jgi:hypothetical protein
MRGSFLKTCGEGVERCPSAVERVGEQVTVPLVDLIDARSHEAGELEQRDARGDGEGREGVPQRVGRAVLKSRSPYCRLLLAEECPGSNLPRR